MPVLQAGKKSKPLIVGCPAAARLSFTANKVEKADDISKVNERVVVYAQHCDVVTASQNNSKHASFKELGLFKVQNLDAVPMSEDMRR